MMDPLPPPPPPYSFPPSLPPLLSSAPSHSHGDPGGIVSLSSCRFSELRNKRSLILIVQETAEGEGGSSGCKMIQLASTNPLLTPTPGPDPPPGLNSRPCTTTVNTNPHPEMWSWDWMYIFKTQNQVNDDTNHPIMKAKLFFSTISQTYRMIMHS